MRTGDFAAGSLLDLVTLNIVMPKRSSLEVLALVEEHSELASPTVVIWLVGTSV
ncbi:MAG: hypothetical protein ACP5G2_01395 [Candidatus Bipolaricaulaceae bacterium]